MNIKQFLSKIDGGFTLVELMVVVAIIGLLSSVAVPNFKKYQARAKIAEAKLHLAAVYTAEKSFYSDFNMYAACLGYMGYDPSNERQSRYYAVGFFGGIAARDAVANESAIRSGLNVSDCPPVYDRIIHDDTDGGGDELPDLKMAMYNPGKGVGGVLARNVPPAQPQSSPFIGNGATSDCSTNPPTGTGSCLGSQADSDSMTFRAAAAGVISAQGVTGDTMSQLAIDNTKKIELIVPGY
jgi:prepilin-type N-terminal cleavage/methylation domain-containing protein